jgi:hypothetical protein
MADKVLCFRSSRGDSLPVLVTISVVGKDFCVSFKVTILKTICGANPPKELRHAKDPSDYSYYSPVCSQPVNRFFGKRPNSPLSSGSALVFLVNHSFDFPDGPMYVDQIPPKCTGPLRTFCG